MFHNQLGTPKFNTNVIHMFKNNWITRLINWTDTVASDSEALEFFTLKQNEWMNEWMFNDTPARKTDRLLGVRKRYHSKTMHYQDISFWL